MQKSPPLIIKDAKWLNAPNVSKVLEALNKPGPEDKSVQRTPKDELARIVGGAVRNHLLGHPVADIDIATKHHPEQVIAIAKACQLNVIPTGLEHGTITFVVDGENIEVTTLRKDVKTDGRHAIVEYGTDWEQDARRRDFTINALYLSQDGTVHDPLKTGIKDIKKNKLRFIGEPGQRIKEDYLRILRFYRLAATHNFENLDQKAISSTVALQSGLDNLSAERKGAEIVKLLSAKDPQSIIEKLYLTGILTRLLSSATKPTTLLSLLAIEKQTGVEIDPLLRLSILTVHNEEDVKRIQKRLRLSNRQAQKLNLTLWAKNIVPNLQSDYAATELKKFEIKYGKPLSLLCLLAAWAQSLKPETDETLMKLFTDAQQWTIPKFPVQAKDLLDIGYEEGPELGAMLGKLEDLWLEKNMKSSKEELLKAIMVNGEDRG